MPFSARETLASLKDFQRRTVDYIFQRMFVDASPTQRFLVADEVGLGKTMVARGVIAKTLELVEKCNERADFVYICSNAAIAHQNVGRLNVLGKQEFALASRLTLLPLHVKNLAENRVNFISFTPGTAFDLKSQGGLVAERVLIFRMLRGHGGLNTDGLANLLHATATPKGWAPAVANQNEAFDIEIAERYVRSLQEDTVFFDGLRTMASRFRTYRADIPHAESEKRYAVIGDLRQRLAMICLESLSPRLVIVDEFQRFRYLLQEEDPASELAHALFNHPSARVLLLSATPYKMLSLDHEKHDDHYPDFLKTLGFLYNSKRVVEEIKRELDQFRRELMEPAGSEPHDGESARDVLQRRLRQVMCRTERVSSTTLLDAMTHERSDIVPIAIEDLDQAKLVDGVSLQVEARDSIEYWKSTPYALNYMGSYELRKKVAHLSKARRAELTEFLQSHRRSLLTESRFKKFQFVAPANARLRTVMAESSGRGLWKVLWLPPSLPAWQPAGPFKGLGSETKSLVFSAWDAVPDAIASLGSYEAERLSIQSSETARKMVRIYKAQVSRPLRLRIETDGSAAGMTTWLLMYPSPTLARIIDPIALSLKTMELPSQESVLERVAVKIGRLLTTALSRHEATGTRADERWYWVALALLDGKETALTAWIANWRLASNTEDGGVATHKAHSTTFLRAATSLSGLKLGPPPADLAVVLAKLALGSPAVCALRSLKRLCYETPWDSSCLLSAAARVGSAFQSLLNVRESITILRDASSRAYWELALQHGLDGNLGSLLDEQVHVLVESLGVARAADDKKVGKIAEEISNSLSIRTASLSVDELSLDPRHGRIDPIPFRLRCRFSLRFGDLKDEKGETRAEVVRSAFNSPFRPFVLASTSVGQEGLDFHVWCHAIVHWNLPSNPVDMEQREGRVHRYKGHAVRKNVARVFGRVGLRAHWQPGNDPWKIMFDLAKQERGTDLKTYWLFEIEGGARIERRVPLLPLAREQVHLNRLKRGLALYRLVFGQPRQEELLTHLDEQLLTQEQRELAIARWRIDLTPLDVAKDNQIPPAG